MVQWRKALATKPEDLSSVLGPTCYNSCKLSSVLHVHTKAHMRFPHRYVCMQLIDQHIQYVVFKRYISRQVTEDSNNEVKQEHQGISECRFSGGKGLKQLR